MILKNEFFKINVGKRNTEIEVLEENNRVVDNLTLTNIEFDNLCHLIVNNKEKIFKKVCFEEK